MLLGVAKHRDAQLIFHLLHQYFKVLHEIMEILHTDVLVVQIFELYAVITESDMSKLKEADRKDWFSFILTTLRTWSAFNPGESTHRVGEIRNYIFHFCSYMLNFFERLGTKETLIQDDFA